MFLSRFGVKNYKCLGEIDIPLTPIHVLIGQNDAGKTSLLEAMAAFYESSQKQLPQLFPEPWTGRELVFHGSQRGTVEFSGEWSPIQSEVLPANTRPRLCYGFSCRFHREGKGCMVAKEWIEQAGARRDLPPVRHGASTAACSWNRGAPQITGLDLDPALASLRVDRYSLDAKTMRAPAVITACPKFRLGPDGFGLPTLLDDILGNDPERFLALRADFCRHFPQFRGIQLRSVDALDRSFHPKKGIYTSTTRVGKGIVLEMQSGHTIHAQQASDGAILFLGFLALSYLPEPPTLLLIEEPENGIYPKRLAEVIQLLKQLVYRSEGPAFPQIILSTHSPYVLSFFEPDEVTFLSRPADNPEGAVRARPLRDAPNIREKLARDELYLGELWYNFSEEEIFDNA
ncbi:MAG: AAA family ATPase [Thermoguttaceae bacterium]